ncbi:MAG: ATP-binding protein [Lachnospiraceae bacterium]|nr:ATP-binding protein [Lachnospiraceae bacterium]
MLLKYIVSNYKSIGHPIEFSMFPTEENVEDKYLKSIETKMGTWKILRRGGFFGPNASGKTSFVESLKFARDFIVKGRQSDTGTGVNLYKGSFQNLERKALFQFMFFIEGEVYEYGLSMDEIQVYEEWLYVLTSKGLTPMFTRVTDEKGKTQIEIEAKYAKKPSEERKLAEVLKNSIQEGQINQLYLYKLYDNGAKKVRKIMEWFKGIQVMFPTTTVRGLPLRMNHDRDFQSFVSNSLEKLDTGVTKVSVVSDEINFIEFAEKMDLPKEIIADIEEKKNGIISINGKYFIFGRKDIRKTVLMQIKFEHRLNDEVFQFNIEDESDGTQRLLDLLPIIFGMNEKSHMIYCVDEIDRSLHTKLSMYLLNKFLKEANNTCNQIIFTAHDVNLINLNEFSQNEIWFVEKNMLGETKIKPFSDFDIKDGKNVIKSYLAGRFGAIPVIKGGI